MVVPIKGQIDQGYNEKRMYPLMSIGIRYDKMGRGGESDVSETRPQMGIQTNISVILQE